MNIRELHEQRDSKVAEMRSLIEGAGDGDLEGEAKAKWDALEGETRSLKDRIRRAESMAELERAEPGQSLNGGGGADRELRNYSLAKALQESMSGNLTGLEAEVHADLARGRESRGVMVPTAILLEQRAIKTTTPGAGPGANLIGREQMPVTDHPRPTLLIESLGATVMRNLVGNIDLPRLAESGSASWIAEHTDATRTDPKFSKTQLTPKTVAAEYEVSRRMTLQASQSIEDLLRRDLSLLLRGALDRAAIAGEGGLEPTGVINTTGIQTVTGGPLDSDITADMIGALELDDLTGSRAFVTNPNVMKAARKTKDADGRIIPVSEIFHGERVETTTQIGNNGATPALDYLIYGQWAELVIGYWSGVDLLANPYHTDVASKGGVLIHAFLDADVAVREPLGFAVAEIGGE